MTVDEANILLMCDLDIVDVLEDGAVFGLFPLDEMRAPVPDGRTCVMSNASH